MTSARDEYSRLEYRRLIAWPQRIQRETALLEEILSSGPSRRLLDLGCGTGEHARYLAAREFEVVGIDRSAAMLESARKESSAPGAVFIEGDLRQIERIVEGTYGGAICLGNTLPHIRSETDLASVLEGVRRRLESGAPLLIQLLNYQRIFELGERHLPVNFVQDDESETVFLRLMSLQENGEVLFYPTTLRLTAGAETPVEVRASKEVRLRGWRDLELSRALGAAGFDRQEMLGSFAKEPYDSRASRDLIIVAR